jgi:hypothetical protein
MEYKQEGDLSILLSKMLTGPWPTGQHARRGTRDFCLDMNRTDMNRTGISLWEGHCVLACCLNYITGGTRGQSSKAVTQKQNSVLFKQLQTNESLKG